MRFLLIMFSVILLSGCLSSPSSRPGNIIKKYIKKMTLEEKIGQLFILAIRRDKHGNFCRYFNSDIEDILYKYKPGGIVLFNENLYSISQLKRFILDIQNSSRIPMFIAIDEEGGKISRLNRNRNFHTTTIPSGRVIGRKNDAESAVIVGTIIGKELRSLGINMDFAPVADINTNPGNPVIGTRAYGSNPEIVSKISTAVTEGLQGENVCSVIKHFPGHGDTFSDPHKGTALVFHTLERLYRCEFLPFKAGIKKGVDGIMTAHILLPKITGNRIPATFSRYLLTDILRTKLKYEGLIITDSLTMKAVSNQWTSDKAALMAIEAGVDIILMPESPEKAYNAVLRAVRNGEISIKRIDASIIRILKAKLKRKILYPDKTEMDPEEILGCKEHKRNIAELFSK